MARDVGLTQDQAADEILGRAAQLMGGEPSATARALAWYQSQPLVGFGGSTAMDLVREGRADAVLEHLAMLDDGGYG